MRGSTRLTAGGAVFAAVPPFTVAVKTAKSRFSTGVVKRNDKGRIRILSESCFGWLKFCIYAQKNGQK